MKKNFKRQTKHSKLETKRRLVWRSVLAALLAGMTAEVVVRPQLIPFLIGLAYLNNRYGGGR